MPTLTIEDRTATGSPVGTIDLPDVPDYSPRTFEPQDAASSPEPPLGRNEDWVNVTLDLGNGPKMYRRDTNTMPNWAGSCWYYLRYLDPSDPTHVVAPDLEAYWMGPRPAEHGPDDPGGVDQNAKTGNLSIRIGLGWAK